MKTNYKLQITNYKKNSRLHLPNGFTLIELLVTIGIIAILVVMGIVSYGSINRRSRDTRRKSDIEQIRSALEMYRSDMGYYPDIYSGGIAVFADVEQLRSPLVTLNSYLPDIPKDPRDNAANPYMILFQKDAAQEHYYRYCIAAALEGTGEKNCVNVSLYPSEEYVYGIRNP